MPFRRYSASAVAAAAIIGLVLTPPGNAAEITPEQEKFFETRIRPVLVKECYGCHSSAAGNVRGGLRLDTKELARLGGSSGPAIVPGDPAASLLLSAINHDDFEMPPQRKLPPQVIDDFRSWIENGAFDPRESAITSVRSSISTADIERARTDFWAYQPPLPQTPPSDPRADWAKTEIDRFVWAKLADQGMSPAVDAEPYQVLRRLCFDLIGLPPTPTQIADFEAHWKRDPDAAIAATVDRLLEQPQYGERWGRHWLDVVRYAESTGREINMTYPHAWRYRDFVIDSFNADQPFNHFVAQQIAGDLLPAANDQQWAENLIATTFLAIGPKLVNEKNRIQFQADLIDEQIDVTSRVFLGMSVACARCHDHKFDAIPQTDYYAMAGIFSSATTYFGSPPSELGNFQSLQARRSSSLILLPVDDPNPFDPRYSSEELADLREQGRDLLRQAADARRKGSGGNAASARIRTANQLATISAKLAVVDEAGNPRSYCMGVQENSPPTDARLLVQGEIDQPAQSVPRGIPQVLNEAPLSIPPASSGRLELARWIGSDRNPLTARVMANRVWQHLLGHGIVRSTENFGVTGSPPSHPELLDHLALRFIAADWSVKQLIREITSSRVYRISSRHHAEYHRQDPDNALLWRAHQRRLDAEAIRDAMLSISGELDTDRPRGSEVAKVGYTRVRDGILGDPRETIRKSLMLASEQTRENLRQRFRSRDSAPRRGQPAQMARDDMRRSMRDKVGLELSDALTRAQSQLDMLDANYRSVYLPIVRDHEPRSLQVFDFADSSIPTGVREASNTANQALYMLNNPFVLSHSESFARRVAKDRQTAADRVAYAYLLAYGRPPTSGERAATAAFLKRYSPHADGPETLSALCHSLLASAEFRYVD